MTILTEKDSVAKNIAQALKMTKTKSGLYESADKKIKMTYAAGHLYTLYDFADYDPNLKSWYNTKSLPFVPLIYKTKADDGFKNVKRKTRLECEEILRNAIKTHDEILIATDPDREGEVIARFILDKLKADYSKVTRLWCCEGVNEEEVIKENSHVLDLILPVAVLIASCIISMIYSILYLMEFVLMRMQSL